MSKKCVVREKCGVMAKQGMRKYKDVWKHEFEGHTAQETMGEGDTYAKE